MKENIQRHHATNSFDVCMNCQHKMRIIVCGCSVGRLIHCLWYFQLLAVSFSFVSKTEGNVNEKRKKKTIANVF